MSKFLVALVFAMTTGVYAHAQTVCAWPNPTECIPTPGWTPQIFNVWIELSSTPPL